MLRQTVALKAYVKINMNNNQNKEYKLHENRDICLKKIVVWVCPETKREPSK